jgi:hypothetical protein
MPLGAGYGPTGGTSSKAPTSPNTKSTPSGQPIYNYVQVKVTYAWTPPVYLTGTINLTSTMPISYAPVGSTPTLISPARAATRNARGDKRHPEPTPAAVGKRPFLSLHQRRPHVGNSRGGVDNVDVRGHTDGAVVALAPFGLVGDVVAGRGRGVAAGTDVKFSTLGVEGPRHIQEAPTFGAGGP